MPFMSYRDLTPKEAQQDLKHDPSLQILDVRTPPEHQSHHLPGAVLIPVQVLQQSLGQLDVNANWLVYCEHGMRSLAACDILAAAGFKKLANLRGGIAQWQSEGLPLQR